MQVINDSIRLLEEWKLAQHNLESNTSHQLWYTSTGEMTVDTKSTIKLKVK